MTADTITRFEPHGPADTGLVEWEPISPDDLIEGTPVQRGHFYYLNEETGLSAGVWDCTAMTTKMEPYPVNEFMHVLEGEVTMVHEDGSEFTVSAGENFVIPKGAVCSWKQPGYIRKYFVIHEDASGATVSDPSSLRAFKIDTSVNLPPLPVDDASGIKGEVPTQHHKELYCDPTGQFVVGLWQSTPFEREVGTIGRSELMIPISGSMTLMGDGSETSFGPGDVPFVPQGAPYGWRSTEPVTKVYCSFTANAAVNASAAE